MEAWALTQVSKRLHLDHTTDNCIFGSRTLEWQRDCEFYNEEREREGGGGGREREIGRDRERARWRRLANQEIRVCSNFSTECIKKDLIKRDQQEKNIAVIVVIEVERLDVKISAGVR